MNDNVILSCVYLFKIFLAKQKEKSRTTKMSLDTQKLDTSQRQQIMSSVQQQLAVQNAQELLQVSDRESRLRCHALLCVHSRNCLISVSRLAFRNPVVLYLALSRSAVTSVCYSR